MELPFTTFGAGGSLVPVVGLILNARQTAGRTFGGAMGAVAVVRSSHRRMVAGLHRHCAGQRLVVQLARKEFAVFVKIGVPGIAAVTQQLVEGEEAAR